MERYLVQDKRKGRWCNIKSYSKKEDAELVVDLIKRLRTPTNMDTRILDRENKEVIKGE